MNIHRCILQYSFHHDELKLAMFPCHAGNIKEEEWLSSSSALHKLWESWENSADKLIREAAFLKVKHVPEEEHSLKVCDTDSAICFRLILCLFVQKAFGIDVACTCLCKWEGRTYKIFQSVRCWCLPLLFSFIHACSFHLTGRKKLYDDIFAFICHIWHWTSCSVTIAHADIAISMLKRHIVWPYLAIDL